MFLSMDTPAYLNNKYYSLILIGLLLLLHQQHVVAMTNDSIVNSFYKQFSLFPQEKIHAHIDKKDYMTGDDIRMRIYLLNAQTHIQDSTSSRYVYVELINPESKVIERKKIRMNDDGVFYGHIPVYEDVPVGTYHLRFYTKYMTNLSNDLFYTKEINVRNSQSLSHDIEPGSDNEQHISVLPPDNDYDVTFFPEGGNLPIGESSKIAFKAINSRGLSEDISGVIINERGDTITHFSSKHRGMGAFIHAALRGEKFYAICKNKNNIEKKFELPSPQEDALSLQIFRQKKDLIINIAKSFDKTLPDSLNLTLLHNGSVIYSSLWNNEYELLKLPETILPTGIVHILLTDKQLMPLSERLIFNIDREKLPKVSLKNAKKQYSAREKVKLNIDITDFENKPLKSDLSISIVDNDFASIDTGSNMLSNLLLSSNLRGNIEDPAYYFRENDPNSDEYLDFVMMTHGWSRYDTKKILSGDYVLPEIEIETSQLIRGRTKGGLLNNRPLSNASISLLVTNPSFHTETKSDKDGSFLFDGFEFPENTQYHIQGKKHTELDVVNEQYPAITHIYPNAEKKISDTVEEEKKDILKLFSEINYRDIQLGEVVVTAQAKKINRHPLSSSFTKKVTREEIERLHAADMYQLLRTIPGVQVSGRNIVIGSIPQLDSGPPLIFVDGVEVQGTDLIDYSPRYVVEIEVLRKVAETTIFGLRGNAGVILITTREGTYEPVSENETSVKILMPLGYQITKEFYSPTYETKEKLNNNIPDLRSTVYWNPHVVTGKNGKATIDFYTSDNPHNYVVVIEGITDDGRIIQKAEKLGR